MTDIDRLLELEDMSHEGLTKKEDKEYNALKSKIEQDLESGIICARNCANMAVRIGELEQQVKTGQQLCKTYEDTIEERNEEYKSILKEFFTLELEEKNDEIKRLKDEVESLNNILDLYKKWGDGLTQKLEQIEALFKYGVPQD